MQTRDVAVVFQPRKWYSCISHCKHSQRMTFFWCHKDIRIVLTANANLKRSNLMACSLWFKINGISTFTACPNPFCEIQQSGPKVGRKVLRVCVLSL